MSCSNGVVALLQARMSSTRLPNKVMRPLLGEPMLGRQLERLSRCLNIDQLQVVTSSDSSDDPLAAWLQQQQVPFYRGALDDVLDRFYQAAQGHNAAHIVRLTGDCPLTDPSIIDAVIEQHLHERNDYTSNCAPASLPDGLDVEVFTIAALRTSWQLAHKPSEREHVTLYLRNHSEQFKLGNYQHQPDLSSLRWTVDEARDMQFVEAVYAALYPANPAFGYREILSLLQRQPQLLAINSDIQRNEGLLRSLQKDKELGYE